MESEFVLNAPITSVMDIQNLLIELRIKTKRAGVTSWIFYRESDYKKFLVVLKKNAIRLE